MDGGSVVHLAHVNYSCEATAGQCVWTCRCVIPLHATIWTVPQTPKYHTIGGSRCQGARLAVVFLFHLCCSLLRSLFLLEPKYCLILLLKVHWRWDLGSDLHVLFYFFFYLITLEMFTIHLLPLHILTQILIWCFQVAKGAAYFAEGLICGGDFHLCWGLKAMIPSSIL